MKIPLRFSTLALLMVAPSGCYAQQAEEKSLLINPTLQVPGTKGNRPPTGTEQAPKLMAAYEKRWNEIKTRAKVPDADQLYTPGAKMSGAHPRYLFAGTPLSTMKARWKDPRFARRVAAIKAQVAKTAAEPIPAQPNLDAEDPLRPYAEKLAPMALVLVLDDDVALKKKTMESLEKWVNATLDWGLPLRDLPLSQQIFALGTVYDWLHNDLSPELKSKIRTGIIERARWMRDPANASAYMWRGTQHSANHNWFNYGALAMASAVLWGESEGLQPGETKLWMDEAIQNFTVVEAIQPKDGGTMEGYLYQDYGLRPYFDFAVLADQLTNLKHSFVDNESVRNLSSRVFSLFPGNTGFLVYGDSEPTKFGSAAQFRYIASRLKDSRAQLLAQIMENSNPEAGAWRTLFWSDSAVPAAKQSELPLYHDQTDLGLYTARSSWDANASFFGLRAGPASGATAASVLGDGYTNGHVHPDQGNFSFYQGAANVIPGSNYARTKVTTHHNLVVFEGRDKQQGEMVGQLGGGLAWFGKTNSLGWKYDKLQKHATVTEVVHKPEYHSYLADLGGVYLLTDERDAAKQFYPTYLRSLTYLTNGAVVIVDRVEVAQPRTFHFRLLTAAQDLTQNGKEWAFTVKGVSGKIVDLSPQTFERSARKEENHVWRDAKRDVAILTAKDQTKAIFVTVLGMNGAEKGIAVKADDAGVSISGAPGGPINLAWKVAPALNAAK